MLASRVSFYMISNPAIDSPRYLVHNVSWISIPSWTTVAFQKCLRRDPRLMDLGYPTEETTFPPLGFALSNFTQVLFLGAHLLGMGWIKPNHPFPFQRNKAVLTGLFYRGEPQSQMVFFPLRNAKLFSTTQEVLQIYIHMHLYIKFKKLVRKGPLTPSNITQG